MKTCLALLALATSAAGSLTAEYVEANHQSLFGAFKQTHGKNYTASEEAARKAIFKMNMLKAAESQTRHPAATFGFTKFSDLTEEEFKPYTHGMVHVGNAEAMETVRLSDAEVAQYRGNVDWRERGAVTAVKNQAACGSCWSFSTTGVTEGANFLHGTGELVSLSEQQFVSCDKQMYACQGGLPVYAYQWAINAMGGRVVTEASYPYVSGYGNVPACASDLDSKPVGATIRGAVNIAHDEEQMAAWLAKNGPISIGINAADDWQSYTGGILTGCRATQPDHAVLIVGKTEDAWVIKNSWGPEWGEGGYIRLAFGSNQCNIVFQPSAPTM